MRSILKAKNYIVILLPIVLFCSPTFGAKNSRSNSAKYNAAKESQAAEGLIAKARPTTTTGFISKQKALDAAIEANEEVIKIQRSIDRCLPLLAKVEAEGSRLMDALKAIKNNSPVKDAAKLQGTCSTTSSDMKRAVLECSSFKQKKVVNLLNHSISANKTAQAAIPTSKTTLNRALKHTNSARVKIQDGLREIIKKSSKVKSSTINAKSCERRFKRFIAQFSKRTIASKKPQERKVRVRPRKVKIARKEPPPTPRINCSLGKNFSKKTCEAPLLQRCSSEGKSPSSTCQRFVRVYCNNSSGASSEKRFCTKRSSKPYCSHLRNSASPTCIKQSLSSNPLCDQDPSSCMTSYSENELLSICLRYPGDPICENMPPGAEFTENSFELETTPLETDYTLSSGRVFTSSLSGVSPIPDVDNKYSTESFSVLRNKIKRDCNRALFLGCSVRRRSPASRRK